MQNAIEYVTKRGIFKNKDIVRNGLYNGLAARQMLAHHHSANSQFPAPDALRTQFLLNLAAVGEYPKLCRKVAIINGTNTGALNPKHLYTDETLLEVLVRKRFNPFGICKADICNKIHWVVKSATNNGTNKVAKMWTFSAIWNSVFWVPVGYTNSYAQAAWGNSSQDNAPGGTIGDLPHEFKGAVKFFLDLFRFNVTHSVDDVTMMPSYSAADLRFPSMADNSAKNLYMKWSKTNLCGHTPFDYVYSPDTNQIHVSITQESSNWFEKEINCNVADLPVYFDPIINGPDKFCGGSNQYSIPFCKPSNATINWNVSDINVAVLGNNTGNQVTLYKNKGGIVTLYAQIKFACSGLAPINLSKTIRIGTPSTTAASLNVDKCGKWVECYAGMISGATSYTWNLDGRITQTQSNYFYYKSANFSTGPVGTINNHYISVKVNDACGTSAESPIRYFTSKTCSNCGCSNMYIVLPNPAHGNVRIVLAGNNAQGSIREIKIVDKMSTVVQNNTFSTNTNQVDLDITRLRPDVYYLHISNGTDWTVEKLVVQ
ncbi:hypothetical protein BH09BAC2_BH09BAC2_00490 [soil metagenome]